MPIKAALSEEEYLRTSFPGVDQEYRDGELVERSVPDLFHGRTQGDFYVYFRKHEQLKLFASIETRLRMRPGRYVIPDVVVFWPELPTARVPETLPLIVIEILSPDDRLSKVRDKLQEYADWGVAHIWLVDSDRRVLYLFRDGLHEVKSFTVPEVELEVTVADIFG
jgi:Uma2 family endonuclease